MESWRHLQTLNLLADSLRVHFAGREDVFVAGNMAVYFSELQARRQDFRAPDLFVVLDAAISWRVRERKSWVVWEEEGQLPNLVVEILSESTEKMDRGEKMRIYARVWRMPEYFLVDPFAHTVEGFRLDPTGGNYVKIPPDTRGDVPSLQLGLALGFRDEECRDDLRPPFVRWIRPDGVPVPTAALAERSRADDANKKAHDEKRRADALADEVATLRKPRPPGA
jgi:Uma2 family endonuclease